jgi:hypothetical protein
MNLEGRFSLEMAMTALGTLVCGSCHISNPDRMPFRIGEQPYDKITRRWKAWSVRDRLMWLRSAERLGEGHERGEY